MKVLGIDPGLASCGWAVVEKLPNKEYELLSYGEIKTEKISTNNDLSSRLKQIYKTLQKVIKKYKPDIVCLEEQFYSKIAKNMVNTYLAVGVVYLLCGMLGIDVKTFSAKTVKLAVTGYGSATKLQLKKMVKLLLKFQKEIKSEHINDAAAVALCYLNTEGIQQEYV
ncbi:MAG: crossover junction endodeoxyribonuclease RuvC [Endomicrobia bacterium]|nr:crossover junction endodeoxyribonuclease RuvC [Endomicrobiia bacterium]